jgi:hypothetical protein
MAKLDRYIKKSKYHDDIITELIASEKESSGFFLNVITRMILQGPLTPLRIETMIQVFSGRYVNEDKMAQYHENVKKCGVILANFGTIRSCYLAIQLSNMVGKDVYPRETCEMLTHALLEDAPQSFDDRWYSMIAQGYFISN